MSGIPYCDKVLEVTGGCTKCAPGCRGCWAIKEVWRMAHNPLLGKKWQGLVEKENGVLNWTGKIKCFHDALEIPSRRKKPTTYFVDSKADLFHKDVPFEYIVRVLRTIEQCPQHTFLIFTKRPEIAFDFYGGTSGFGLSAPPLPNVQLILSISTQAEADEKIPIHLQIPAAVHGLSIEPMLGPIDLRCVIVGPRRRCVFDCLRGTAASEIGVIKETVCGTINWVVVGGESGKGARYCPIENIRSIVKQCKVADVPVFVKQIHLNGKAKAIKDINQFPKDLRIQQLPER